MKKIISAIVLFILSVSFGGFGSDWVDREDVVNRYNGPPLYRYYDRLHRQDGYSSYERWRKNKNANTYWGSRYYGNENPDIIKEYELNRKIMDHKMEADRREKEKH